MKATMLLCDAAQVADGKLYVLGGGWSLTGPDPMPSAVAIKVEVDWHEANQSHHWELFLLDADGQPVGIDAPEGSQLIEVGRVFEVCQPDLVEAGAAVDVPLAVKIWVLPLGPGRR